MHFFVLDNQSYHIDRVLPLLRKGFSSPEVKSQVCRVWNEALQWIRENVPDSKDSIILLDLCLEGEIEDREKGIINAEIVRGNFPLVTLISYSQYAMEYDRRYKKVFAGFIDKGHLFKLTDTGKEKEAVNYLTSVLKNAIEPAHLLQTGGFVDSFAMRLIEAAFDNGILSEMAGNLIGDLDSPKIEAITGGYSGAFVLKVSGYKLGVSQNIIIKAARSRSLLEMEGSAYEKYLGELGPLLGVLVPPAEGIQELGSGKAYFISQPTVSGKDCLESFHNCRTEEMMSDRGMELAGVLLNGCKKCFVDGPVLGQFADRLQFTDLDTGRFTNSVELLIDIAKAMDDKGKWPKDGDLSISDLEIKAGSLVLDWGNMVNNLGSVPVALQHGDLNPRNIFLTEPNYKPFFIDLARLGFWPVGYDLARLALQLRMRLTSCAQMDDHFPDSFEMWIKEPIGNIALEKEVSRSLCPAAAFFENALCKWLSEKSEETQQLVQKSIEVTTLWDLVKIVSYGDLSIFKRVWALYECIRLFCKCFP